MQSAVIPGIPDARYWVEVDTAPLARLFIEAGERSEAAGNQKWRDGARVGEILALSGGSDRGAFGAGLLVGWTEAGDRPQFGAVTGTSTGALIAPFAFLGPDYDPVLREVYTRTSADNVFKQRPFTAVLFDDALTDTAPLRALIAEHLDADLLRRIAEEHAKGRLLMVATTNLDANQQVVWDLGAIASSGKPDAVELVRDIVLASAAIPGSFPPVMIDVEVDGRSYQEMHVDGGMSAQVFVYPPSFDLRSFIQERPGDGDVDLYIIRNARLAADYQEVRRQTLAIGLRSISLLTRSQGVGDLYTIYLQASRDEADFNLAFIPDDFDAPRTDAFDTDYMNRLFNFAYEQARNGYSWMKRPPGYVGPQPIRGPDAEPPPATSADARR